jgi:hypothetical protein
MNWLKQDGSADSLHASVTTFSSFPFFGGSNFPISVSLKFRTSITFSHNLSAGKYKQVHFPAYNAVWILQSIVKFLGRQMGASHIQRRFHRIELWAVMNYKWGGWHTTTFHRTACVVFSACPSALKLKTHSVSVVSVSGLWCALRPAKHTNTHSNSLSKKQNE